MKLLKIAASASLAGQIQTAREIVLLAETDFTDVAALVVSRDDVRAGLLNILRNTGLSIPAFVALENLAQAAGMVLPKETTPLVLDGSAESGALLEAAADNYQQTLLPPFFDTLTKYVAMGNSTFACPGHQGGEFFRKHPAGRQFYEFFGENMFRADMCNADVKLGDLLIHEGSAKEAQKFAAKVFNADKTYFVLNGTSSANKVVTNALLTRGDLVLFDRNNHKSVHHGALIQAGATPVYLETARNPFGLIGGIDAHCFDEKYLRRQVAEVAPWQADKQRPFRLAVIQLGTYDGTIYNARQVVDKIGGVSPTVLDVITNGEVDLVINTMSNIYTDSAEAGGPVFKDGFEIRRAAVERRIPCLTSLDTAVALVESEAGAPQGGEGGGPPELEVRTIVEWRQGVPA